jgi:rSAM/selenodomain-associated transferase 2
VPALDEEGDLPRLLAALAAAPRPADRPDEVIVADGGSRDGTCAVALSHGARLVRAARGRGAQLAAGARVATGELFVFLHADSRPVAGALAAVRAAFVDADLAAAGMRQRIDGHGLFYRLVERAADLRVRLGRVYGDSALCVRRSAYEAVGGYRPVPLFEDLDLSRRLRRGGHRIALLSGAAVSISARRWQTQGRAATTLRNWGLTAAFALGVAPERLARYYPERSTQALDR